MYRTCAISWIYSGNAGLCLWKIPGLCTMLDNYTFIPGISQNDSNDDTLNSLTEQAVCKTIENLMLKSVILEYLCKVVVW